MLFAAGALEKLWEKSGNTVLLIMLPKKELGASFLTYPNLKQVSQKDESEYSLLALMGIVTMFLASNWETSSMAIDNEVSCCGITMRRIHPLGSISPIPLA